jgi:hypothetical protein
MAITIIKQPDSITPVWNDLWFVLNDTNYGTANYKYKVKLYYKTDSVDAYTLLNTFSYFPLINGNMEFNCSNFLKNLIENDIDVLLENGISYTSMVQYQVFVYKSILDSDTLLYTFDEKYSYDGALQLDDYSNLSTYVNSWYPNATTTESRLLSNLTDNLKFDDKDYYSIDFLSAIPGNSFLRFDKIKLTIISAGSPDNVYEYKLSDKIDELDVVTHLGITPTQLNKLVWNRVIGSGETKPFDNEGILSYTIVLYNIAVEIASKTINVDYGTVCHQKGNDRNRIAYKSKHGGWSYLDFNYAQLNTHTSSKGQYQKRMGYNSTYTGRGITDFTGNHRVEWNLSTGFITNEGSFFEDLFASPNIFLIKIEKNSDAKIYPVNIIDSSVDIKTRNNDKLFNYTLNLQYAHTFKKQLR